MAIRTEKSQISFVRIPVFEPARPCPLPVLWVNFMGWVYMINVQCAEIIKTAYFAFPAETLDKAKFSLPVRIDFVHSIAVFVPVSFLSLNRAVAVLARVPALQTFRMLAPSVCEVTFLITIFSSSVLQSIRMCLKIGPTVLALFSYGVRFHVQSITENTRQKYFDIACERITAAYAQGRLFN